LANLEEDNGWTVLAATVSAEACPDAEVLQAYQEQHTTVEPGFRWIKTPAAISPMWLEQPERSAALAMLTFVGLLVYAVIPRQGRLSRRDHDRHIPGTQGPTTTPPAAAVCALLAPVMRVHFALENMTSLQPHGVQAPHRIVGEAGGMAPVWEQGAATGPHALSRTIPPLNVGSSIQKPRRPPSGQHR
jgi:hypothetical protein